MLIWKLIGVRDRSSPSPSSSSSFHRYKKQLSVYPMKHGHMHFIVFTWQFVPWVLWIQASVLLTLLLALGRHVISLTSSDLFFELPQDLSFEFVLVNYKLYAHTSGIFMDGKKNIMEVWISSLNIFYICPNVCLLLQPPKMLFKIIFKNDFFK